MPAYRRKTKRKTIKGCGISSLPSVFHGALNFWGQFGEDWQKTKDRQLQKIKMLKQLKNELYGGKFERMDLIDGFLGPIGWLRMGLRKARDRKIKRLQDEIGLSDEELNVLNTM